MTDFFRSLGFVGQNNNPGDPSTVGTPDPNEDPLIQKINSLNMQYIQKIDEINRNVQTHIGTLGQIKLKIDNIMNNADKACNERIQDIIKDHQGKNEGSKKETEKLQRDLGAIKTKYDNASKKITDLISNVNSNESLVNLQQSVNQAKDLGTEIMSSDQSGQTGEQTDDFNNTFDVSSTTILGDDNPAKYGARALGDYFKMFPKSAFNDIRYSKLHTKIWSGMQLTDGELEEAMDNSKINDKNVKNVIRNLRAKIIKQYKIEFKKDYLRGGYISTKKRRRANRHSKNFFRFSRKLPNNKSKPKRKRK